MLYLVYVPDDFSELRAAATPGQAKAMVASEFCLEYLDLRCRKATQADIDFHALPVDEQLRIWDEMFGYQWI